MKVILRIADAAVAEKFGLESVVEINCTEEYCASSFGYPVFLIGEENIFTGELFRQLRDTGGATLETDNPTKVCLGLGLARNEPGLVVVEA
ncbi:hypothetical protein [Desulfuromonas sp. CSMB_57]|uniref:hypothetical protein n=1 Tax=Desulfuromonas sp. CSMB_57 TaxID=2807629 RepID=UPI001CD81945|nr:hypothetical protein [Desulfuromonas sp. CSMB_57]